MASTARKRIGPYRLLGELGSGGMGVVRHAVHEGLQRPVAIKELHARSGTSQEHLERFRREGLALAQLRHESVVGIHDLLAAKDRLYMVLEYVDGWPLSKLLEAGALPWDVAALVGQRLADALDHAHHHKVIHRDLKPANVMLSRSGEVKLMDFGIARDQTLDTLTRAGVAVGTPSYMPPEVLKGDKADVQSDLYSLGVVLYEMLGGRRPFDGKTPESLFGGILKGKYPPLRKLRKGLPPALTALVERCLSAEPHKRPASARELQLALGQLLQGTPGATHPRGRLVSWLTETGKLTQTEALTCVDAEHLQLNTSSIQLAVPPPSGKRFLLAVASLAGLAATFWWATQQAGGPLAGLPLP